MSIYIYIYIVYIFIGYDPGTFEYIVRLQILFILRQFKYYPILCSYFLKWVHHFSFFD